MSKITLPRFWTTAGSSVMYEPGGLLVDPRPDSLFERNEAVSGVSFIDAAKCLVLLGEPGVGKSTCIRDASKLDHGDGAIVQLVDLGEVRSAQDLDHIVRKDPAHLRWSQEDSVLHIYFDSFDEGFAHYSGLPARLVKLLSDLDRERVMVRIASRVFDWSSVLEAGIRSLWKDGEFRIFELLPFRAKDVVEYADISEINGKDFLQEVRRSGAAPFAGHPITLPILVDLFRQRGELSKDASELFEIGCSELCKELRQNTVPHYPVVLSDSNRLRVAARIATLSLLSGRDVLYSGTEPALPLDGVLTVPSISGGRESIDGDWFEVSEQAAREAMNTALFSLGVDHQLTWSHSAFRDFLAALYVVRYQNAPLAQVLSLITHSQGSDRRVVPQLAEVAAWMAVMRSDVFDAILENDPFVLLQCLTISVEGSARSGLVEAILQRYAAGEPPYTDWSGRAHYRNLDYEGICEQLRPYIVDSTFSDSTRIVAVHIATEAKVSSGLSTDLVELVLDKSASITLRVSAAHAILAMGQSIDRSRLRGLLTLDSEEDPDAELRGGALMNLWPGEIGTREMLDSLVPSPDLFGTYKGFLYDDPISAIPDDDLGIALDWVDKLLDMESYDDIFRPLVNEIMGRSWKQLADSTFRTYFARVAAHRYQREHTIFGTKSSGLKEEQADAWHDLRVDTDRRRMLWDALIDTEPSDYTVDAYIRYGLLTSDDRDWVLEQYVRAPGSVRAARRVTLMSFWVPEDEEFNVKLDEVARSDRDFYLSIRESRERFQRYKDLQVDHDLQEDGRRRQREEKAAVRNAIVRTAFHEDVKAFAKGDIASWWRLHLALCQRDGQAVYESALENLPGWNALEVQEQAWFAEAAVTYIRNHEPQPDEWIRDSSVIFWPDWSGYRAFRHLWEHHRDRLDSLASDDWRRWVPVIVAFPMQGNVDNAEIQRRLVEMAYQHSPEMVIGTALDLVRSEKPDYAGNIIARLKYVANERVYSDLVKFVRTEQVSADPFRQILVEGVRAGLDTVVQLLMEVVKHPDTFPEGWKGQAIDLLWSFQAERCWDMLWNDISRDSDRAQFVAYVLANIREPRRKFANDLSAQHLADLYILLEKEFPTVEEDSIRGKNGEVTSRQQIDWLKGDLLRQLEIRGTPDACNELLRILGTYSSNVHVAQTLYDARVQLSRSSWNPTSVQELKILFRSSESRLIQSQDDLMDVVLESLARFQERLTVHQPPMVAYLWNELPDGQLRPKDEERLSDFIKAHLDIDLAGRNVVVNREVVNRRGEEIDILVDAIPSTNAARFQLAIEVKGRWNDDIWTALDGQLVDRYMSSNGVSRGVYVAGWYSSLKWDPRDYRSARQRGSSRADAQERLSQQATARSNDGRRVRAVVLDLSL